jgi:epoxide hydrolase
VAQLAWIVEKFHDWNKTVKTLEDEVGRDRLLTNATLYWLTGPPPRPRSSTTSPPRTSARSSLPGVAAEPVTVLIGVAVFGQDRGLPIRNFAEPDSTITHWSEFDRGGHFAAMEQPELYVGELRKSGLPPIS